MNDREQLSCNIMLHSHEIMMMPTLYLTNKMGCILIELDHI